MYKKSVQGWLKHLDFMILDVVCLWISFTLAFNMRHGSLDVLANSLYRDMMWSLALMDIVVIFFFDSLKNVLKRGFYQEFVMTVKQTCLITLCSVFYLFTFKEAENYSRLVLGYTAALYLLLSYVLRCLWKNCLRKYFGGAEKRSLLIVTVSDIVDTVIDNIKNKNYGDYFVTGVCILDKKAKGRVIDGVTVVADEDDLVEYVCREWVDEVFINIPESEPYPAELLDKFIEMGVVVHMKLAKSQNLLGKKQFVEHLGTYTVLTTSINSVSRRQIILKRMLDILGGLAGCIITGILCIFVGPAIYIQSPGPIFFKQTRVGKNGKLFQMYKFRSMYMDAEERKAELMKENRVQDGMMFKLDFDPRIIGSKKLPDGTIKKGVGNFIRDWSLDEFPQFLNVLKGDMSLVGTRPPTVDEWDKYELHHRARLATKPGLTGMWQVSGRSNITDLIEVPAGTFEEDETDKEDGELESMVQRVYRQIRTVDTDAIMASFRKSITEFAGKKVLKCLDYSRGIDGLPKSDVLKFFLEDNCSIVVRPSGTEPKLKAYISVSAATKEEAQVVEGELARAVEEKM